MVVPVESMVEGPRFVTRFLSAGEGTPVLFLHGAAGVTWSAFHDQLAEAHQVYVSEHPGFGRSPWLDGVTSVERLAEHYTDVMASLGLETPHIIGSSLGGWLASELAIRASHSLRSLTVLAPVGMFPRPAVEGAEAPTRESYTRMLYFDQSLAGRILERSLTEEDLALQLRNREATARYTAPMSHNPGLQEQLQRLDLPASVVWGEDDKLVSASHAEHWAAALHTENRLLLQRCGHLPHVEKPVETATWVRCKLRQIESARVS